MSKSKKSVPPMRREIEHPVRRTVVLFRGSIVYRFFDFESMALSLAAT